MTKALVIGGSGFIGHHIVALLNAYGIETAIYDNQSLYADQLDPIAMINLHAEREKYCNTEAYIGPAEDFGKLRHAFMQYDPNIVIYAAGYPRSLFVDNAPWGAKRSMIDGLENALQAANRCPSVTRFVYLSSSMVYGNFESPVDETAPLNPQSLYAAYKVAGEQLVKVFVNRHADFEYTIIRPSAVYGPRDITQRVVGSMFLRAFAGKPIQVRGAFEQLDFSYVGETAMGIVKAASAEAAGGQTFNISRGKGRTLLDAAELIRDISQKGCGIECTSADPAMPSRAALNVSKATDLIGHTQSIDIEEGFKYYYDWLNASTV